MMEAKAAGIFSVVATLVTQAIKFLLGSFDPSLNVLFVFVVLDFISGVFYAWKAGTLSSRECRNGIMRKGGVLMVIIVAQMLDYLTGQHLFRMAVVYFFIATEGISILENLGKIGVPIPAFLMSRLKQLQSNQNDTVNDGQLKVQIEQIENAEKKDETPKH